MQNLLTIASKCLNFSKDSALESTFTLTTELKWFCPWVSDIAVCWSQGLAKFDENLQSGRVKKNNESMFLLRDLESEIKSIKLPTRETCQLRTWTS